MYAEPRHKSAADLQARAFEQLAYAAEASTWRNAYLTGAYELRNGTPDKGLNLSMMTDMLQHAPTERFLERMAASIDGRKAAESKLKVNLVFSDIKESYVLTVENGVLHHHKAAPAADANATLTLTKPFFLQMMTGQAGATDLLLSDQTRIDGSKLDLGRFFALIEKAPGNFPIVTR
jgi:alkyl sulfatase BDS1-like metallo-beta-lactamase superfamily hydrolase